MVAFLIPHFDIPIRYVNGVPATVEQDTIEDITNCVEVLVRTTQGQIPFDPAVGIPDLTFYEQPIHTDDLVATIMEQEPRSEILINQETGSFDPLVDKLIVEVSINE